MQFWEQFRYDLHKHVRIKRDPPVWGVDWCQRNKHSYLETEWPKAYSFEKFNLHSGSRHLPLNPNMDNPYSQTTRSPVESHSYLSCVILPIKFKRISLGAIFFNWAWGIYLCPFFVMATLTCTLQTGSEVRPPGSNLTQRDQWLMMGMTPYF